MDVLVEVKVAPSEYPRSLGNAVPLTKISFQPANPYKVHGWKGLRRKDLGEFMLLTAQSARADQGVSRTTLPVLC
jgi:hypothetical protein